MVEVGAEAGLRMYSLVTARAPESCHADGVSPSMMSGWVTTGYFFSPSATGAAGAAATAAAGLAAAFAAIFLAMRSSFFFRLLSDLVFFLIDRTYGLAWTFLAP